MIWTALFLLCAPSDCITASSPLFSSKNDCEQAVYIFGMQRMEERFSQYTIIDWKCVSFGEAKA